MTEGLHVSYQNIVHEKNHYLPSGGEGLVSRNKGIRYCNLTNSLSIYISKVVFSYITYSRAPIDKFFFACISYSWRYTYFHLLMVIHFTVSDVKFLVPAKFSKKGFRRYFLTFHSMLGFGKYYQNIFHIEYSIYTHI